MKIGRTACFATVALLLAPLASEGASGLSHADIIVVTEASAAEIAFWRSVESAQDPAELEAYLAAYPNGQFAPLAKIRLQKLKDAQTRSMRGSDPKSAAPVAPPAATPRSAAADANIPPVPPHARRGWIGAQIRHIDEKRAREIGLSAASGAEIETLVSYGPAAKGGLRQRDAIVAVNGTVVTDHKHLAQLTSAQQPGETVELTIIRDGKRQIVKVPIGNYFVDQWTAGHRGDALAMRHLGTIFAGGQLVAKDQRQANEWLRKAANAGDVEAMSALGWRYQTGIGLERDDREAARWYRKAADGGHAESMFSLGLFYYRGQGLERDYSQAIRWYRLAIEKEHPGAILNYGLMLQQGQGVEKNEALAIDYFRRAAKLGRPEPFAALGLAYYSGRGVRKDLREAAHWYREAANRGVSVGFSGLATMYERGEGGLSKNRAEAIKYYRKAAEAGNTSALERLKALKVSAHDPKEVQQLLSDLGFDPGPIDGRPTRKSAEAIREFQRTGGLTVDGEASLRLVGQLRDALKQKKAAATKSAEPSVGSPSNSKPDFGGMKSLDKFDSLD